MAKITIPPVESQFNTAAQLTSRFKQIENELNNKVLYRANPVNEPNAMSNDLDMNSRRILNLPAPILQNEPVRLQDLNEVVGVSAGKFRTNTTYLTFTDQDNNIWLNFNNTNLAAATGPLMANRLTFPITTSGMTLPRQRLAGNSLSGTGVGPINAIAVDDTLEFNSAASTVGLSQEWKDRINSTSGLTPEDRVRIDNAMDRRYFTGAAPIFTIGSGIEPGSANLIFNRAGFRTEVSDMLAITNPVTAGMRATASSLLGNGQAVDGALENIKLGQGLFFSVNPSTADRTLNASFTLGSSTFQTNAPFLTFSNPTSSQVSLDYSVPNGHIMGNLRTSGTNNTPYNIPIADLASTVLAQPVAIEGTNIQVAGTSLVGRSLPTVGPIERVGLALGLSFTGGNIGVDRAWMANSAFSTNVPWLTFGAGVLPNGAVTFNVNETGLRAYVLNDTPLAWTDFNIPLPAQRLVGNPTGTNGNQIQNIGLGTGLQFNNNNLQADIPTIATAVGTQLGLQSMAYVPAPTSGMGPSLYSGTTGTWTELSAQPRGNLVAGQNVILTGNITGRLYGSGDVTIQASGGGGGGGGGVSTVTSLDPFINVDNTDIENPKVSWVPGTDIGAVGWTGTANHVVAYNSAGAMVSVPRSGLGTSMSSANDVGASANNFSRNTTTGRRTIASVQDASNATVLEADPTANRWYGYHKTTGAVGGKVEFWTSGNFNPASMQQEQPNSMSVTYRADGLPDVVTEVYPSGTRTEAYTYNAQGLVNTVTYTAGATVRVETYTYTNGRLTGMTAT